MAVEEADRSALLATGEISEKGFHMTSFFPGTCLSLQWGALMVSCRPCAALSPLPQKKSEQLLLTSQPLL
ncbi:hypothetical protein INR49_009441 [Caranx melampygus]|nr:hypothetical protein INR49_009441 [Caranx melampygus]